jgi:hypothetical protein
MYGITPSHAMTVNVYSLDGKLINSLSLRKLLQLSGLIFLELRFEIILVQVKYITININFENFNSFIY